MVLGKPVRHYREEFKEVPPAADGDVFYSCTFHKLNGAELKNCTLMHSKLVMTKPEDIIGLTMTLDCNSFNQVELSPEVFDLMLLLLCRSKGNNTKRLKIIEDVVGHDRAVELLKYTEHLERQ